MIHQVIILLKRGYPLLPLQLRQAGMPDEPEEFLQKTLKIALIGSFAATFLLGMVLTSLGSSAVVFLIIFPLSFLVLFSYFMKMPILYIARRKDEIEREIVYMGRYLILELEAGISIYVAMKNIAGSYEHIGKFFKEIVDRVDMGTSMEEALNEAILLSPSPNMVRILWQILNTIKTGSDIKVSLNNVLEQITREQMILIKEYGKKLNPLAMMYMIIAIIFPSLGVTVMVIITAFLNIQVDFTSLAFIALFIGFTQFIFYTMIKSMRPAIDL